MTLACPTCRTGFRGQPECPRCGTDLSAVMAAVASSVRLRNAARDRMTAGRFDEAERLAADAQHHHVTDAGRDLLALARLVRQLGLDP